MRASSRYRLVTLRSRVFTVVALSAVPALIGSVVAITALARVNDRVGQIDRRSVNTMTALADLRDMEGDMRIVVRDYIEADTADRSHVRREIADTDKETDADIAQYLREHGTATDRAARQMASFRTMLARWRAVRDSQILPAVDADRRDAARAAVRAWLSAADAAMAGPLDAVFEAETKDADARVAASRHDYVGSRVQVLVIIGLGLIATALVAWWLIRRPVALLGRVTAVVTGGDLTARVGSGEAGDVGDLGRALDDLLSTLSGHQEELAREQAALAQQVSADFARQRAAEREVRRRAQAVIDETSTRVLAELGDVVVQAELVRLAADEIDSRTGEAERATRGVVDRAAEADRVVGTLTENLHRVGGIAKMIAGVAEQTNLLALNATIEAARAGDAGKGFSVVASEVKGLAAETGRSTTEIASTVGSLESDATAMAQTVAAMSLGVAGMGEANARVGEVAARQRESVGLLHTCVQEAISRIRAMSELTEQLERRAAERVRVSAPMIVRWNGRSLPGEVADLSESGARCSVLEGARPPEGTIVELELELVGYTETVQAQVVRATPAGNGNEFAAAFRELTPEVAERISRQVQALTGVPA